MRYQETQKMTGSMLTHSINNEDETLALDRNGENENSLKKYLKFWGDDYAYLKMDNQPRWLPIPEDSEAQRFLRNSNRTFQLK